MRNMKKFLALVLAMMMVFSMAVITTSAADEADYTEAALQLNALNVMKGDLDGNLMLDADVTRYQTALFFVQALTGKTEAEIWNAQKTSVNFADVNEYGTAIDYAYGVGVVKGRGNGVFGFNDKILYKDMIVMAIRALGYETAETQYPYGHILAAKDLNLLDGIEKVDYEAALNRGETAQLIWNMLKTEVAAVDPLTNKVLYPGDYGLSGAINEELKAELLDRETLLEKSGLAGGKVVAVLDAVVEADEDDEDSVDTVVLNILDEEGDITSEVTVAAADLGLSAETAKVTYAGLEVELYITVDVEDFDQDAYDEGDAEIVLAIAPTYTVVESTGDATIKYVPNEDNDDKSYVSLGGTKFTNKNYEGELFLFDEENGVWVRQEQEAWEALAAAYLYDTKEAEYIGAGNTYGKVAYRVIEKEDDKATVEVLYTPYTFGQYITRELKYNVTGKNETFTIIGTYDVTGFDNLDGENVAFKETFVGSGATVNSETVSKRNGEAAVEVTVEGVEIESGDFMFYNYNAADNILTVAKNCGTIETGRLTAYSNKNETVKISGTNYEFGFAGLYDAFIAYDDVDTSAYVEALEAGKDNVQFLAVDGSIVWMDTYTGEADAASYGFAIVSFDAELLADLLGISDTKFANALVGGYYLDDGYVVAAGLDVATGKWELVKIEGVVTAYDTDEEEFIDVVDVATLVKYADIATLAPEKADSLDLANDVLATGPIYTIVEADGDVLTLADIDTENGDGEKLIERVENENGLTFNVDGRTNKITASADVDAARVTTGESTVIVVIGTDSIEVRTGKQTDKKDIDETVTFFAADASLIVATTGVSVDGWGQGTAAAADEVYYIAMPGFGVEYETEAEEDCTLTITGLYDLKALEMADDIVITKETMAELQAIADAIEVGTVCFLNEDGEFAATEDEAGEALAYLLGEDYSEVEVTEWIDDETILVTGLTTDKALADIKTTVITLDLTEIDWKDDVDVDNFFLGGVDFDAEAYEGLGLTEIEVKGGLVRYNYHIELDETVVEISEPTLGLYSQFEIDNGNQKVYELIDIETVGTAIYDVDYYTVAAYDDEAQVLTLYVVRLVNDLLN